MTAFAYAPNDCVLTLAFIALLAIKISGDCPPPPRRAHATYRSTGNAPSVFKRGHVIVYSCETGFVPVNSSRITCRADGTWTPSSFSCKLVICSHLPIHNHGWSYPERLATYGSRAELFCEKGYTWTGTKTRTCQANGKWSGKDGTCKGACGRPPNVRNARMLIGYEMTYPTNKAVAYKCKPGFVPRGPDTVTCLATGQWTSNGFACDPRVCGDPGAPEHGKRTGLVHTFGARVQFTCNPGYTMKGRRSTFCQADGTWSNPVPTCEGEDRNCPPLTPPSHGGITPSGMFTRGTKVTFHCEEGYSWSGSNTRTCMPSGQWSGQGGVCQVYFPVAECSHPGSPIHGRRIGNVFKTGSTVRYVCDAGYAMQGSASSVCKTDGTWSSHVPVCHLKVCGDPGAPEHGKRIGQVRTFGARVRFACDSGYTLRGRRSTFCQADGTWSNPVPTCKGRNTGKCPPLTPPSHGVMTPGGTFTHGTKVTFHCDEGYSWSGSNTRTCMPSGQWSGQGGVCQIAECSHPGSPLHGRRIGNAFKTGATVHFVCDSGYVRQGSATAVCQSDGTWSSPVPTCHRQCTAPPPANFTRNDAGSAKTFNPGHVITFTCVTSFAAVKVVKATIRCRQDGTWSILELNCKADKMCGEPPHVDYTSHNGSTLTRFSPGHVISYSCQDGFYIHGTRTVECQDDGEWTKPNVGCTRFCGAPPLVENSTHSGGPVTRFLPGYRISYECDPGFQVIGVPLVKCQGHGQWTAQQFSCNAIECPPLEIPSHGSLEPDNKFTIGTEVVARCEVGYTLVGSETRTCLTNKKWNGTPARCQAVMCPHLGIPNHGSLDPYNKLTFDTRVTFACDEGYRWTGSRIRTCQINGQWSGRDGKCQILECPRISAPRHGRLEPNKKFTSGMSVTVICTEGFHWTRTSPIICNTKGQWDGTVGTCMMVECPRLTPPSHGRLQPPNRVTYGTRVTVVCDQGYTWTGSAQTCLADGHWSGNTGLCAVADRRHCQPLRAPAHARMSPVQGPFVVKSRVTFTCDHGYMWTGSPSTLVCQANQRWSATPGRCEVVSCRDPGHVAHGTRVGQRYTYRSQVRYQCDIGYRMRGSASLTCTANRKWNPSKPTCAPVECPPIPPIAHGQIVPNGPFEFGITIAVQCDPGYVWTGSTSCTCMANGQWSGTHGRCEAVKCPTLSRPVHGQISPSDQWTYGVTVTFTCDTGYHWTGSDSRTCRQDGQWTGRGGVCEKDLTRDCPLLSKPEHGKVVPEGVTSYMTTVTFSCDRGYWWSGSPNRVCQNGGKWSGTEGKCRVVECVDPGVPRNGWKKGDHFTYASRVQYGCDEGYELKGAKYLECQYDFLWNYPRPTCKPIKCPPITAPANGRVYPDGPFEYGVTVSIICNPGFYWTGTPSCTCMANGTWHGRHGKCEAVNPRNNYNTPNLHLVTQRRLPGRNFRTSTQPPDIVGVGSLTYFTDVTMRITQPPMLDTRRPTSNWVRHTTPPSRQSTGIDCGIPDNLNGVHFTGQTTYGSKIRFMCNSDVQMLGASTAECLSDGSWSNPTPECIKPQQNPKTILSRDSVDPFANPTANPEPEVSPQDDWNLDLSISAVKDKESTNQNPLPSTTVRQAGDPYPPIVPPDGPSVIKPRPESPAVHDGTGIPQGSAATVVLLILSVFLYLTCLP